MEKDNTIHYLALQSVEGIGPVGARKLLKYFGSPEKIFSQKEKDLLKIKGLGPKLARKIKGGEVYRKAETELKRAIRAGVRIRVISDEDYPENLKHCADAPLVLFCKGEFDLFDRRLISIVGTRKMTSYGSVFLSKFIRELKKYNPIIISGLAYGVDICAHRLALQNGLSTIGVLAHGMDRIYPRAHYQTALAMTERGGLMTEFWMGTSPEKENFVKRNRIIAGLSEATLVVESSGKGGSLITADLADSYHREVFAVPGKTTDQNSIGCNRLIKSNKALMLTEAKDLEYMLNWSPIPHRDDESKNQEQEFSSEMERKVYNNIRIKGRKHVDQIALECECSISVIFSVLLQLELSGKVKSLAGHWYELYD